MVGERLARDKFHNEGVDALRLLDTVNGGNVRVTECCKRLRFALEPRQPIGILRERFGQNFNSNLSTEVRVARAIDLAHTASADGRLNLVGSEASTGTNTHSFCYRGCANSTRWETAGNTT